MKSIVKLPNTSFHSNSESELDGIYHEMDKNNYMQETNINGKKVLIIGSNYASPVVDIDKFIHKVIETNDLAFDIKKTLTGSFTVKELHLAKYYKFIFAYQTCHSETYWYSEHVELFFKCIKLMGLWGYSLAKPNQISTNTGKLDAQIFNDLISLIRKESKTAEFTFKLNQRVKNSHGNYISAKDYISALFEKHSRLLVVRVNPGYLADFRKSITINTAQKHIRKFLNNWRNNKLFEYCIGYIWKIEMGDMKGFHFHFALFFNGNRQEKHEFIAQQICDYWNIVITKGEGTCHNSNRKIKDYQQRKLNIGIGMIEYGDFTKRKYLLENIEYITKTDQYIKLKSSPKTRTFGRGAMPEILETPLGRPRTKLMTDEFTKASKTTINFSRHVSNHGLTNLST